MLDTYQLIKEWDKQSKEDFYKKHKEIEELLIKEQIKKKIEDF